MIGIGSPRSQAKMPYLILPARLATRLFTMESPEGGKGLIDLGSLQVACRCEKCWFSVTFAMPDLSARTESPLLVVWRPRTAYGRVC